MARAPKPNMPPLPNKAAENDELPELDVASEEAPEEQPAAPPPQPIAKRMIKVKANRAGFIKQERKVAGDVFEVEEHQLGAWMDCVDPVMQKKHLKRIADKNKAINAKAIRDHEREIAADE